MWDRMLDLFGSRLWEPHGHCFLWTPSLLWTMVIANLLIGLAYYSIPLALLTLVRRRRDLLHKQVFVLFALFIFGCGTTHLIKIWTLWVPVYWLQGTADALTAWISIVTAIALWPLLPQILRIPSPAQLQSANEAMQKQILVQQQTEDALYQRTIALESTNRALAIANDALEALNYSIAHDLRSPLRAIANLATWIHEDAASVLPSASQVHLSKLHNRVHRLERLIDDLLLYARIGKRVGTPESVATGVLINDVVELLDPPPGFTITVADPMPTLYTPRAALELVFRNLIGNAIKHHRQPAIGQVAVTAQDLGDKIEFCVTDNGPGIDPQFHTRIFGLFQTLQPRDVIEGSGVGLALVKKSVEQIGGAVSVESAEGAGATFRFIWPKQAPPSSSSP